MKKAQSFFISALTMLAIIGLLNGIINYFFLWENNGKKYYQQYIENSKEIKVRVDEKNFNEKFGYTSYLKYTIFYKGITGGSKDYMFLDNYTNKYYKIMRFDVNNLSITSGQRKVIKGKELYVMVNNEEIYNPDYGTLAKPIHVFSFKGVNEKKQMNTETDNGTIGWINLEPTQQEYEYNVTQYLTYVMSGKEFKERFEKK
ncbi:hypothetical protein EYY60_16850 [Flavobacterium zhairuonense]|uniref:hypothetical protein n=1 Tax=Flavobacterium zhairuonense TaxID=2493631 RepID=UPI00104B5097|nr:hypothetical protein [Flavobacterium zhairuonense]KAF2507624.1 hypothetical protein EYY60_16850 [Flavobacterium zhairuonense]